MGNHEGPPSRELVADRSARVLATQKFAVIDEREGPDGHDGADSSRRGARSQDRPLPGCAPWRDAQLQGAAERTGESLVSRSQNVLLVAGTDAGGAVLPDGERGGARRLRTTI
jgi:hypothetical protein